MFESGHLTLVSGAGEGEVVSKKVGKEVRGAQRSSAYRIFYFFFTSEHGEEEGFQKLREKFFVRMPMNRFVLFILINFSRGKYKAYKAHVIITWSER